ncbi:Rpn family recombination-promoting nuclease/putative transposase [Candidatus Poribacteria bacterium]|nr:Rpn family recombination-promoting nuclease/putative transposase [Candidatus Poribacteria bacterium]
MMNNFSPPPIHDFLDRGIKWLLEFIPNLVGVMNLIAPNLAQRLDFDRVEHIPTSFIPDNLRQQESDLLFRVPFLDPHTQQGREVWIYLLIEHQSTPDLSMGFRILFYMTQVWDMQRRQWLKEDKPVGQWRFAPILPTLFYTGERKWDEPITITTLMDLPAELRPFTPQHEVLRFDLKRRSKGSLTSTGQAVGWALSVLQQEESSFDNFAQALRGAISALEPLEGIFHAHWEQLMYFLVLMIYYRRQEPERQPLLQLVDQNLVDLKHREEVTKMGLTAAEFIRQQTRQQTQQQTQQQILTQLMEIKFGALTPTISQALQTIDDSEKLRTLLQRILTSSSLSEVESFFLNGSTK